jgi:energy-coupling factor transport system permease protein
MALAASMDARGFGRRGSQTDRQLLLSRVCSLSAVAALAIGAYLLIATELTWVSIACFGLAISGIYISLKLAENANSRSRYSQQGWRVKDSVVAGISTVLVALFICGVIK